MRLRRVLVIHDSRIMRHVLRSYAMSELLDVAVYEASGAAETVRLVEEGGVDVVFCGNEMAHESGVEIFKRVRALPQGLHLPFVLFTSEDSAAGQAKIAQAGIEHVMVSPFTAQAFAARVNALVDPAQWRRSTRYAVPGARVSLLADLGRVEAKLVNLSAGGMCVDFNLEAVAACIFDPVQFDLHFPAELGGGQVTGVWANILQVHVISHKGGQPENVRTIWTFSGLSPLQLEVLEASFARLEQAKL